KLEDVLSDPYYDEMTRFATARQITPAPSVPLLTSDNGAGRPNRVPKKIKHLDFKVRHHTYGSMSEAEGIVHLLRATGKELSTLEVTTRLAEGGYRCDGKD